jgi:colanic acid biosynthesis glycosyl transferase WcaI
MRVVVWGINYRPEVTGIGPFNAVLCEFLLQRGHQVEMLTAFPYYPQWTKRECDRGRIFQSEEINGVIVHRCWTYVPRKLSAFRRILHEASFVSFSFLRMLSLRKPAVFIVVSPPLLLGIAGWLVGLLKNVPFVFHVQDLQPDAAVALGMIKKGLFVRMLYWIEKFSYSRAAKVSGISEGMISMFRKKGVEEDRVLLFPNSVRLPVVLPVRGAFRARHRIATNAFLAVYSGNLGIKQGLNILIDAAVILQTRVQRVGNFEENPTVIVIAGDGAQRLVLEESIARSSINMVRLLPLLSDAEYQEMMADADCTIITQQRGTGAYFFPSKLLSSVSSAKPVLSVADDDSELAKAVMAGKFGINVPPERPELLASALDDFSRSRACANGA